MQLAYPQNDTRAETLRYLGAGGWQPDAASQVLLQKAEDALRTAPFLQRMLGSGTRKESDAYLINCGVNPADLHTVAYFDSIESIKRAIEQGMGIAIMSEISVLDTEQQKKVLVFRNENPFMHRRLYCVYRKERQLSPTAELFVKYLKDTCQ